jgi:hypothetical protein
MDVYAEKLAEFKKEYDGIISELYSELKELLLSKQVPFCIKKASTGQIIISTNKSISSEMLETVANNWADLEMFSDEKYSGEDWMSSWIPLEALIKSYQRRFEEHLKEMEATLEPLEMKKERYQPPLTVAEMFLRGDLYEEEILDKLIAKSKARREQQSKTTGTDSTAS